MSKTVAVVTGSNKGLGYGCVKKLLQRGVNIVYLTARDVDRGMQAVGKLNKEGYFPEFHKLDVTDENSIKAFADHLKEKYGGIDILMNNAAIIAPDIFKVTYDIAKVVVDTNYKSLLTIQQHLFPILRDNARVINISSDCGNLSNLKNPHWIEVLSKSDLTVSDINNFVDWFLESVKNNSITEEDFVQCFLLEYKVSKIAMCALTRVQQRDVGRNISVNSIHPGFIKTDMTYGTGYLTIEEASEAPVYLALDIDQSVKGKFFWFDKTEKEWTDVNDGLCATLTEEFLKGVRENMPK